MSNNLSAPSSPRAPGRLGLYAATIFTSAFLLFQVQPLIGKYILPWFGGGPGVWTTCLLFFQVMLLGGYTYAHALATRLTLRRQVMVHLPLMLVALLFLPIIPAERWAPLAGEAPTGHILLLLTVTIGLPYLVLSATGPLFQAWFARENPGVSPYRLYALSNAGSLLALLSYPFVFEPVFGRVTQAWGWSAGMLVFVALAGWCAWGLRRLTDAPRPESAAAETDGSAADGGEAPGWGERFLWVCLAGTASILLLAVTNKLTQDVAAMPFLWVLPLALYLLTFILCFDHSRWYRPGIFSAVAVLALVIVSDLLMSYGGTKLPWQIVIYGTLLFAGCMVCHGELYRARPAARHLTAFYLWVAAGGALGGLLVAVVAPAVLDRYAELQFGLWALVYLIGVRAYSTRSLALATGPALGLALALLLLPAWRVKDPVSPRDWWNGWMGEQVMLWQTHWPYITGLMALFLFCLFDWRQRTWARVWTPRLGTFPLLLTLAVGLFFVMQVGGQDREAIAGTRNFYGTLHVFAYNTDEPRTHYHLMRHGGTTHGLQLRASPQSTWPTTYYGEDSGVGRAMRLFDADEPRHFGVVGLGPGTLAAYARAGDRVRFYEINAEVIRMAEQHFTYLRDTAAETAMVLGDARLMLEAELARGEPQGFDVLALDAFSSDAIPVHLLTREAIELYLAHLAPGGILAIHTSNRYLDLRPVVENLAYELDLAVATIHDEPENWWNYRSTWILLAPDMAALGHTLIADVTEPGLGYTDRVGLWTDDYASLLRILR
jgi:spermidine synthase